MYYKGFVWFCHVEAYIWWIAIYHQPTNKVNCKLPYWGQVVWNAVTASFQKSRTHWRMIPYKCMRKVHRDILRLQTSSNSLQGGGFWGFTCWSTSKKAYSAPQGITFLYSNSQDGMIHKDLWSLQHFKAFPWRKGWKMKEQGEPTAPPDSCFGQPATNRKRWCGWFALLHSASIGERRPAPLFWCWFSIDLFAKCNWLSHILQLQRFLHDGEANRSAKHGATNILHTATTSPCWQSVDLTNLVSVPDIHD